MKLLTTLASWARRFCDKYRPQLKSLYYDITEALILVVAAGVMTGVLYVWMLCW